MDRTALAKRHGVDGWPTLLWFRAGSWSRFPRLESAAEIVQQVSAKVDPPVVHLRDAAALHAFRTTLDIVIVYYGEAGTDRYTAFAATADGDPASATPHKPYGHVSAPAMYPAGVDLEGTIIMYKSQGDVSDGGHEAWYSRRGMHRPYYSRVDIEAWVQLEALPPVLPVELALQIEWKKNYKYVLAFVDGAEGDPEASAAAAATNVAMAEAYSRYKGRCVNVLVNVAALEEAQRALEYFGVSVDDVKAVASSTSDASGKTISMPLVRGFDNSDDSKFHPQPERVQAIQDGQISLTEFLIDFAEDMLNGSLQPKLKSQAPVAKDEDATDVVTIVGSSFQKTVLERPDHVAVLLEVYAPWCGHCKRLAPDWTRLAAHYAAEEEIMIAKMDGTANEVAGLNVGADAPVTAYPTIRYYPAGHDGRYPNSGETAGAVAGGLPFTGSMTYDGLIAFVEEQEAQQAHMGHHEL